MLPMFPPPPNISDLSSACLTDSDCADKFADCSAGVCVCPYGFIELDDRCMIGRRLFSLFYLCFQNRFLFGSCSPSLSMSITILFIIFLLCLL